jgi:membrane protease YdiL (CAAX protease family)
MGEGLNATPYMSPLRAHPVAVFYALAFAVSWLGFVPVLAGSSGVPLFRSPLWKVSLVLPGCGPALAAGIMLRLADATGDPLARLRAAIRWRVDGRWYAVAALAPAALLLSSQGIGRLLLPQHAPALAPLPPAGVLSFALMSLAANPWEEVGWRGFALTRLRRGGRRGVVHPRVALQQGGAKPGLAIASLFHVMYNISGAVIGIDSHLALAAVNAAVALGLVWRDRGLT